MPTSRHDGACANKDIHRTLGKLPIIPTYVREEDRADGTGTTVHCRNYAGKKVEMPGLGRDFALPTHSN